MKSTQDHGGESPPRAARPGPVPWRRLLTLLFVISAGLVSACADMVAPAAPAAEAVPSFSLSAPDCQGGFTQAQCDAIRDALKWLREHSDPDCRRMGDSATKRFNDGKFKLDDTTSNYGYMYPNKDSTWLGSSSFDPGELANTIAHEESHHHGYEDLQDGSGNDAYEMGDKCAKPASTDTASAPSDTSATSTPDGPGGTESPGPGQTPDTPGQTPLGPGSNLPWNQAQSPSLLPRA